MSEFHTNAVAEAQQAFLKNKDLDGHMLVHADAEESDMNAVWAIPMSSDVKARNTFMNMAAVAMLKRGTHRYFIAALGMMSAVSMTEEQAKTFRPEDHVPPSKDPNAKEILFIASTTKDGDDNITIFEIKRENEKIVEFKDFDVGDAQVVDDRLMAFFKNAPGVDEVPERLFELAELGLGEFLLSGSPLKTDKIDPFNFQDILHNMKNGPRTLH